jgi:hypothetical protein
MLENSVPLVSLHHTLFHIQVYLLEEFQKGLLYALFLICLSAYLHKKEGLLPRPGLSLLLAYLSLFQEIIFVP